MQTIDYKFLSSLYSTPSTTTPTILDEILNALGSENKSIEMAAQMVSEFHGPYNGSSPVMQQTIQSKSDGIKSIDSNQTILDGYAQTIIENLQKIDDNRDNLLKETTSSNFINYAEKIKYYLSDTVKTLKITKFKNAVETLQSLLPYTTKGVSYVQNLLETNIETTENIIKKAKANTEISVILNTYPNYSAQIDLVIKYTNEIIGSKSTSDYIRSLKNYEKTYENLANQSSDALDELVDAISSTKSVIGRINDTSSALFDTPLLREFISQASSLHPAVSSLIMKNIEKFPYFQDISEKVGSFYTITSSIASIDPMEWLQNDPHNFMTNNILRGQQQPKTFGSITNMITNCDGLMNTLYLRNMPENMMGFMHKEYSKNSPLAHGFSGAVDSFHATRALKAKAGILPKLMENLQDKLRILDSYFPVMQIVKQSNDYVEKTIEQTTQLVNPYGRPASKADYTPNIPLGTKEEDFSGGRDNENASAVAK